MTGAENERRDGKVWRAMAGTAQTGRRVHESVGAAKRDSCEKANADGDRDRTYDCLNNAGVFIRRRLSKA